MILYKIPNLFIAVLFILGGISCQNNTQRSEKARKAINTTTSTDTTQSPKNPYANAKVTIKPFKKEEGWGYDIIIDGDRYIHQPHMPAVEGKKAFSSEAEAKKVGELVKSKIKKGILPPSVKPEELDSIGIEVK